MRERLRSQISAQCVASILIGGYGSNLPPDFRRLALINGCYKQSGFFCAWEDQAPRVSSAGAPSTHKSSV